MAGQEELTSADTGNPDTFSAHVVAVWAVALMLKEEPAETVFAAAYGDVPSAFSPRYAAAKLAKIRMGLTSMLDEIDEGSALRLIAYAVERAAAHDRKRIAGLSLAARARVERRRREQAKGMR